MILAAAVVAAPLSVSTVLTVGTTVLVAFLAAGSALGGVAAFRTGRTNAIAASAVARAGEAEATAETWKGRLDSVQAEFDAFRTQAAKDQQRDREQIAIAEHEIGTLRDKVATLEGLVTARREIGELLHVVAGLSQTAGELLATVKSDHQLQQQQHREILAALGSPRDDHHT